VPIETLDITRRNLYPSPHFNIAQTYQPPQLKELMRWCRHYFISDGTVHAAITKFAQYPITHIIYEGHDSNLNDTYRRILEDSMDILVKLARAGIDRGTFGNAYVQFMAPMKRVARCPSCNRVAFITNYKRLEVKTNKAAGGSDPQGFIWVGLCEAEEEETEEDLEKYKFLRKGMHGVGNRGTCNYFGPLDVVDMSDRSSDDYRLVFWDPLSIDVDHNRVAGVSKYIYTIPNYMQKKIEDGDPLYIGHLPRTIIASALYKEVTSGKIVLNNKTLFHMARPSLSMDDQEAGYGIPQVLGVMNYLYYTALLRKHQEAIAHEHIVPSRILYPQSVPGNDVFRNVNMPEWQASLKRQVTKWRQDPNDILLTTVPVGMQQLGGDARGLFITPELQFMDRKIVNGMELPLEFIEGGMQWSGSSVTFRMLENQFKPYRGQLQRMLDWVIQNIAMHKQIAKIPVRLAELKAADDMSRRQLLVGLNQERKLSDATLLGEFDIDAKEERVKAQKEDEERARAQVGIGKIHAQSQADIQIAQQMAQIELQNMMQEKMTPDMKVVRKVVNLFSFASPEAMQSIIEQLRVKSPNLYESVLAAVTGQAPPQPQQPMQEPVPGTPQEQQEQPGQGGGNGRAPGAAPRNQRQKEKPLPEKNPPRRKNSPI